MSLRAFIPALTLIMAGAPMPVHAQEQARRAIGADISYATDADDTEVVRAGFNFDWRYASPQSYSGVRIERLRFTPSGSNRDHDTRVYLRLADAAGGWKYQAQVGTDGHTAVGSGAIHNDAPLRQEYFVERDKIETPIGVTRGLYYTFGGASYDVPLAKRTQLTMLAGAQFFTGDNVRAHLRASLIQTVSERLGLSAQLRARAFRNSEPGEYDYYSPRTYVEVLPVIQMRRFTGGWRLLAAAGLGGQRDSGSGWRASRFANLRATSPAIAAGWSVAGDATYSATPITNSGDYHYVRASVGVTRSF